MDQHHYNTFKHFFSTSLNPAQQQAVSTASGVLLVCAGAGSGKTRVITARIAHLILEYNIPSYAIVALTFTNKAAKEMKERIHTFLPKSIALPFVGTFHSYCLKLLKSNPHLLPYADFSLMDESDQEKIIRALLLKNGLQKKITPGNVLAFISRVKNQAVVSPEESNAWGQERIFQELYHAYELQKAEAHCFDFDDLLLKVLELFKKYPHFKEQFQRTVRHLLVDEYQDTNHVQHELLKEMARQLGIFTLDSLCVVGDEDQSIYSWRGATVSNIMHFNRDFPQTSLITIEQNYRSVQPILEAANHVINNNAYRNPKSLWSDKKADDRIRLITCSSSYQEADAVCLLLKHAHNSNTLNQYALLYRSHFQSRVLEEALIRHAIPYKIMGGIQFYDRQEIKDLLAYLRLVVNPFDRLAFARAVGCPPRGLGDKFQELFFSLWQDQPFSSFQDIAQQIISSYVSRSKQESLTNFLEVFKDLSAASDAGTALNSIVQRISYFSYLQDAYETEEARAKKDNVKELINAAQHFQEQHSEANVSTFLEEIALLQEHVHAKTQEHDYIRLMTLHAAKGLEFNTIILTGLEETILPSGHSLYNPEAVEEERRLLYVGITRARERLLITHARTRYTYGQMSDQQASRFLDELPQQHVQRQDASYWSSGHFSTYFKQWITYSTQASNLSSDTSFTDIIFKDIPEPFEPAVQLETKQNKWYKRQQVLHKLFGTGTIEQIEEKSEGKTYVTVRFQSGIKKIDAHFIETI